MPSGGTIDAAHAPGTGEKLQRMRVKCSEPLAVWSFPRQVRTGNVRYIRWMNVFVRVVFISQNNIAADGKDKVTTTKEQRAAQAGRTTTSTERRAHRTAPFTAARNPTACIYFGAFRRMWYTHCAGVSKA